MGRALSRSLAVVALLAVVSATLGVVTPSLARIVERDGSHHAAAPPTWLWESHVFGGESAPATTAAPAKPHAKRSRRPYKPPVARKAATAASAASAKASWRQP
jgi:hypothetical protein